MAEIIVLDMSEINENKDGKIKMSFKYSKSKELTNELDDIYKKCIEEKNVRKMYSLIYAGLQLTEKLDKEYKRLLLEEYKFDVKKYDDIDISITFDKTVDNKKIGIYAVFHSSRLDGRFHDVLDRMNMTYLDETINSKWPTYSEKMDVYNYNMEVSDDKKLESEEDLNFKMIIESNLNINYLHKNIIYVKCHEASQYNKLKNIPLKLDMMKSITKSNTMVNLKRCHKNINDIETFNKAFKDRQKRSMEKRQFDFDINIVKLIYNDEKEYGESFLHKKSKTIPILIIEKCMIRCNQNIFKPPTSFKYIEKGCCNSCLTLKWINNKSCNFSRSLDAHLIINPDIIFLKKKLLRETVSVDIEFTMTRMKDKKRVRFIHYIVIYNGCDLIILDNRYIISHIKGINEAFKSVHLIYTKDNVNDKKVLEYNMLTIFDNKNILDISYFSQISSAINEIADLPCQYISGMSMLGHCFLGVLKDSDFIFWLDPLGPNDLKLSYMAYDVFVTYIYGKYLNLSNMYNGPTLISSNINSMKDIFLVSYGYAVSYGRLEKLPVEKVFKNQVIVEKVGRFSSLYRYDDCYVYSTDKKSAQRYFYMIKDNINNMKGYKINKVDIELI